MTHEEAIEAVKDAIKYGRPEAAPQYERFLKIIETYARIEELEKVLSMTSMDEVKARWSKLKDEL